MTLRDLQSWGGAYRRCVVTALVIVSVSTLLLSQDQSASNRRENSPTGATEVRALWVVRTSLTSPEKINAMVNAAADNGFNTLIVQVRGRGDAYYDSRVEPRAIELKDQPSTFDPLAVTL